MDLERQVFIVKVVKRSVYVKSIKCYAHLNIKYEKKLGLKIMDDEETKKIIDYIDKLQDQDKHLPATPVEKNSFLPWV